MRCSCGAPVWLYKTRDGPHTITGTLHLHVALLNVVCAGMELDLTMEEMMERGARQEMQWEIDDMAEGVTVSTRYWPGLAWFG